MPIIYGSAYKNITKLLNKMFFITLIVFLKNIQPFPNEKKKNGIYLASLLHFIFLEHFGRSIVKCFLLYRVICDNNRHNKKNKLTKNE